MREARPKVEMGLQIISQKEILRAIRKEFLPYLNLSDRYAEDFRTGVKNTFQTFNSIVDYFNQHQSLPPTWADIGLDSRAIKLSPTTFLFVKEVGDKIHRGTPKTTPTSPAELLTAMKSFHGLTNLMTEEEAIATGKLVVEATPIDFEQRSQEVGRLWRERAGIIPRESIATPPEPPPPAPLQITNSESASAPRIVPRRPARPQ